MDKTCSRCKVYYPDISIGFYKNASRISGFESTCKLCRKTHENIFLRKRRDKRSYEKNKNKTKARNQAQSYYQDWKGIYDCAVLGCDKKAEDLHHVNYDDPLKVIPLCKKHHKDNHYVCR